MKRALKKRCRRVKKKEPATFLRRGHGLTYAALFLFTVILYARPAEFYPSPLTQSLAYIVGLITLGIFVVSQITVEGMLTARPREVNLVLLFCLTGLLSIPLAISPGEGLGDLQRHVYSLHRDFHRDGQRRQNRAAFAMAAVSSASSSVAG